ncbi:MAG: insulinase family protein, partial [Bacteroidales bacterium]|nr:insulinase family protein [Bacteroidales bacterium]
VHQKTYSPVSHCGVIVHTGSRHENEDQHGLAHFIEHLLFKGTKRRKAYHILSRMEDVGGELNAYTTKEETSIYSTFYNDYYDRAFDLLSDVLFNSVFPGKEIVKEREVIVDEINSYKDAPIEQIFDDFDELILPGSSLGRGILGTEDSLKKFTQEDILEFYTKNYPTDQIVVSSVGNIDFKKVKHLFEKNFGNYNSRIREDISPLTNVFSEYRAQKREEKKDTYQAHCLIGTIGYGLNEDKRIVLHLINNLLGGPGLNSRLNLSLREKKGYAYNVESNYTTYSDMGILSIYFGTGFRELNKCIQLTTKELKKLRDVKLGSSQLSRAKKQLLGQIAISSENFESQMLSNGKSILVYDKVDSLSVIRERIEKIADSDILEVANEILTEDKLSYLIYK